jgi:hypothetical protein
MNESPNETDWTPGITMPQPFQMTIRDAVAPIHVRHVRVPG